MSSPSSSPSLGRIARQVNIVAGATIAVTPTLADASISVTCNTASADCTANIGAGAFDGQQVLVHVGFNDLDFSVHVNFTGDASPLTLAGGADIAFLVWNGVASEWIVIVQRP